MMMRYRFLAVAAALCAVCSCAVKEDVNVPEEHQNGFLLPSELTITVGEGAETKTSYEFTDGRLHTHWADGDVVFASPVGFSHEGSRYTVPPGGAATNSFNAEKPITAYALQHMYYYPGDKIYNDATFGSFSYEGQVQRKSDPTAHMAAYHTMRQYVACNDYSELGDYDISHISLTGCQQSGCMRFILSGADFVNPSEITLTVLGSDQAVLYPANFLVSYYPDSPDPDHPDYKEVPTDFRPVNSLSLGLEGYGKESSLTAYMMHSNHDMILPQGCTLRVSVIGSKCLFADVPITSATAIKGGYCSTLAIDSGWKELKGDFTRYPWDGDVVTLQRTGKGLDLVLMGDGFIKEDFDDGTYDRVMRQAYNDFFSIEPFTTFKRDFDVFYVKAPSPNRLEAVNTGLNGAKNSGNLTKFSTQFTENSTRISGDNALAREYAMKALGADAAYRIQNALVVVVANHHCHAGTCYNSWSSESYSHDYGLSSAVAYTTLGASDIDREQLLLHEVNGHGFGKLADEYYYSGRFSFSTSYWTGIADYHGMGLYRNVDKYVTERFNQAFPSLATDLTQDSEVLWYDMIGTDNRYESDDVEELGFYEGAYVLPVGFCRPTFSAYDSIMNGNSGIFNAISRRQILYRIRCLKGEVTSNIFGTKGELDYFLQWDAANFIPKMNGLQKAVPTKAPEMEYMPLPSPVQEYGEWNDGVFVVRGRL